MTLVIALTVLIGGLLCLIAGIGVLRLQDAYQRMHATTKAGTIGVAFILLGVTLFYQDLSVTSRAFGTMLFILLTAPVGSHLLGKVLYDQGYSYWRNPRKPSQQP